MTFPKTLSNQPSRTPSTAHSLRRRPVPAANKSSTTLPELTDNAIRNANPLPPKGTYLVTVTGTKERTTKDGRLLIIVSLRTEEGLEFGDVQTVQAPGNNLFVQQGLKRLRTYVDMAAPDSDLTDFYACLEDIEGLNVEIDVVHYKTNDDLYKLKVAEVRPAPQIEQENDE